MNLDRKLKLGKRFTIVDLDDEIVIIPSDDCEGHSELYKAIDFTSITICRWLHSGRSPREIINHLVNIFNVEYSLVESDTINFIQALLQKGVFYEQD